jgi:hypothetical protein
MDFEALGNMGWREALIAIIAGWPFRTKSSWPPQTASYATEVDPNTSVFPIRRPPINQASGNSFPG